MRIFVLIAVSLLAACHHDDPRLTTILVQPASGSVAVGGVLSFTAEGRDQGGARLFNQPAFTWSTSPGGVASIDQSGAATGLGAGTATITASSGAVSGTATL